MNLKYSAKLSPKNFTFANTNLCERQMCLAQKKNRGMSQYEKNHRMGPFCRIGRGIGLIDLFQSDVSKC